MADIKAFLEGNWEAIMLFLEKFYNWLITL